MKNLIALIILAAPLALIADVRISALPPIIPSLITNTDVFPITSGGVSYRFKLSDILSIPALQSPTFTGAVGGQSFTGIGTGLTALNASNISSGSLGTGMIAAGTVTLAQHANLAANSIMGNNTGSPATPVALTISQVNALLNTLANPLTTLGDTIYGGVAGVPTRLSGNVTATKNFLTQTGDGSASGVTAWSLITSGDVPTLNQNTTGSAGGLTGTALTGDVVNSGNVTTLAATTNSTLTSLSKSTGVAVHGTNTNNAAAAGYRGEYVESVVSIATPFTGVPTNLTSISLTAGDWDVSAIGSCTVNGASMYGFGISITPTTGGLGFEGDTAAYGTCTSSNIDMTLTIPPKRVALASTTTYYLTAVGTIVSGTPLAGGRISARRSR